jgi:hypothetical protein
VRRGVESKVVACARFVSYALVPIAVFGLTIFVLVALEARLDRVLVSEDIARSALPMLAIGAAEVATLAIVLVAVLFFVRPTQGIKCR